MSNTLDKNSLSKVQKASIRALLQGLPQYQKKPVSISMKNS